MLSQNIQLTIADLLSRLNVVTTNTSDVPAEVRMGANNAIMEGIFTYDETLDLLQELLDEGLVDVEYG